MERPETETPRAVLRTDGGEPVLVLRRVFADPPERVWRLATDPDEMEHWFPAAVEYEPRPGAPMRFTFADAPEAMPGSAQGEVLAFEPPEVFAFVWLGESYRLEVAAEGAGSAFTFTQVMGAGEPNRLTAARTAYGWDTCLDALGDLLAGREPVPPADPLRPIERYLAEFGLDRGAVQEVGGGYRVRFARDLLWHPVTEVWRVATGREEPRPGSAPPVGCTNPYVPAGRVTAADPPHVLEYAWTHEGEEAGTVRWEFAHDPDLGTRVEVVQTVPARLEASLPTVLAAWHTHLELFFAAVHGEVRCPWPAHRTDELRREYAHHPA